METLQLPGTVLQGMQYDAPLALVVPTCGQPTWKKDGSMVEEG